MEGTEVFAACALGQGWMGAMGSFGVQCLAFCVVSFLYSLNSALPRLGC